MGSSPFNPNVVLLLEGLKPFMRTEKRELTDGILSVINLIGSQHGQEAAQAISKMLLLPCPPGKGVTVNTVAGPITLNLGSAFLLFLILILLILSGNLLAIGSTSVQEIPEISS